MPGSSDFRAAVERVVATALAEDRVDEDVTSFATVDVGLLGTGTFVARVGGVLAGMPVVEETLKQVDSALELRAEVAEGERFKAGTVLAVANGSVQSLLRAERVALNFLQRLSAIAAATSEYVAAVAGTGIVILDTRKTTPGLRALEKYAVRCGGGTNHRSDLASMAMIKDNHVEALVRAHRSLAAGVAAIRERSPGVEVEVEIDSLGQLEEALEGKPEWVLLDNMSPAEMTQAARRTAGRAKLEASGGISLATVRAAAESGVDAISVGALTHSVMALDISFEVAF